MLLVLIFVSCRTTENETYINFSSINNFFQGGVEDDWLQGLNIINDSDDSSLFFTLLTFYLDDKFESIKDEIVHLLTRFSTKYTYDFNDVVDVVENPEQSKSICELISVFGGENILGFSKSVYLSKSNMRLQLIEDLGLHVLDYDKVLDLYNYSENKIKIGVITSAGFVHDKEIYPWLEKLLYEEDEEIASSAVFSLSVHGSSGFSYIARNLVHLSDRLKLISIDLLTFNKVEEAYGYYALLLEEENDLITDMVIKSYKELGLKGVDYIIDGLVLGHIGVKIDLLKLLEGIEDADYLNKIVFLLKFPELQEYLINLYFKKNAVGLIKDILIHGSFGIEKLIVSYAVGNRSNLLFADQTITDYTLKYFIDNYTIDELYPYFKDIGFEDNYIEDYAHIVEIYIDLEIIDSFGQLNGEDSYVTTYFDIGQRESIAELESELFYQNLENWLDTGENSYLDKSLSIKENDRQQVTSIQNEKDDFMDSLLIEKQSKIIKYEAAVKSIVINYRKLTYRLKDFGRIMIKDRGYNYLIK